MFGNDYKYRTDAVCFENLELPMLCVMLRNHWFDSYFDKDFHIPELEEFNKKFKFERQKCHMCDSFCDAEYEGSFNIMFTEGMIAGLNESELGKWFKNMFGQFKAIFKIKNLILTILL